MEIASKMYQNHAIFFINIKIITNNEIPMLLTNTKLGIENSSAEHFVKTKCIL